MKHRIGKIIRPKKLSWLTEDKMDEYVKSMGWDTENAIIDGFIWTQYLSESDYKDIYLSDVNSKDEIIEQILKQLGK